MFGSSCRLYMCEIYCIQHIDVFFSVVDKRHINSFFWFDKSFFFVKSFHENPS